MNHASVFSFVVPVFPARLCPSLLADLPVPFRMTSCIMRTMR